MSSSIDRFPDHEPMIDAREATSSLKLPYYWFADHSMRTQHRIPHYLLGGLVRFRMSELTRWMGSYGAQQEKEGK